MYADPAPLRLAGQAGWVPSAHALGLGDVRLKLTRLIAPSNWLFRDFELLPVRRQVHACTELVEVSHSAAGLCLEGVFPLTGTISFTG